MNYGYCDIQPLVGTCIGQPELGRVWVTVCQVLFLSKTVTKSLLAAGVTVSLLSADSDDSGMEGERYIPTTVHWSILQYTEPSTL